MLAAILVAGLAYAVLSAKRVIYTPCVLLVTLCGFDPIIASLPGPPTHYGIAGGALALQVSDLALAATALVLASSSNRFRVGGVTLAFAVLALAMLLLVWGNYSPQQAGVELLVKALVAFAVGRAISGLEEGDGALALTVLGIVGLHTAAASLQLVGVPIGLGTRDELSWVADEGRMLGFYDHPGELGKTIFLLLLIALPLTLSGNRAARVAAQAAIAIGILGCLLTVSRANSAAIFTALLLWTLLARVKRSTVSRVMIIAVAAMILAASPALVEGLEKRNAADPTGGFRAEFFETGVQQIRDNPWLGVGPNFYSEAVGRYDSFAARGFPIHNSLLLPVAELGAPLAILFFVPIIVTIASAWRRRGESTRRGASAVALLAVLPGLSVIVWTGWGMMATTALPLWYLGTGFVLGPPTRRDHREKSLEKLSQIGLVSESEPLLPKARR